ncbi:unnamed protein product, partial [Staurois parvus]
MTERGQRMLKCTQCTEVANCLQNQKVKTSKLCVAFRLAQQQCVESFMEWLFHASKPYITK